VEETGAPRENHRPAQQTLLHNVVSSTPRHETGFKLTTLVVIGTDWDGRRLEAGRRSESYIYIYITRSRSGHARMVV
jgi:hypothetical protein